VTRVIAYVDGFNLYFGLRSKGWRRYYWLDLPALCEAFLQADQRLERTHYFTARIRDNGRNQPDRRRQGAYIDALRERGVQVHEGHYLEKARQCRQCGATWTDYEEKMTDVNIAVRLLSDAYTDAFDVAFLISADSDLTTPVEHVRARFGNKRVIVLLPPARRSKELQKVAHGFLVIGENALRSNQLPEDVPTSSGYILSRPEHWK
jgi:uncharacterized LabA/DUF88 family protein